jgi:hypothetical protein
MLPTIDVPTFSVELPISKKNIQFRPYLVKEQKILTMAKESGEKNSVINAILQIINNCIITDINIQEELPITDVEYLFYQLRARSESELVNLKYRCENKIEDTICGNTMDHTLNLLTDLEILDNGVSPIIEITENVGIKLKHQRFELDGLEDTLPTPKELFEIIANNVDFIYDENSSYNAKDIPQQKIVEWIGNLPTEKYEKIEQFFLNEPKIIKKLNITCNKCGMNHNILVEDIFDFFT